MSEPSEKKTPFVVGWRDGFMINIPQVDREHKHLFDLVRRLELSTVSATVDELLDYVVTHFTNEQKLMEDSNYPGFPAHLRLHEEFAASVAAAAAMAETAAAWSRSAAAVLAVVTAVR